MINKFAWAIFASFVFLLVSQPLVSAFNCDQSRTVPKFRISANGGQIVNIGSFKDFTFSKASVDIWSNGKKQSLGSIILLAENSVTKQREQLYLHLRPISVVCDKGNWEYEYIAYGTYKSNESPPQRVSFFVRYDISEDGKTLNINGSGEGITFSVINMPITFGVLNTPPK